MDVVMEEGETVLRKSEKKKHKESKEKEALSSSTEKKTHKKDKEKASTSSSEVPTEKKKHKESKEKEALSPSTEKKTHKKDKEKASTSSLEVPKEKRKHKKNKEKEAVSSSDVPTDAGGEKKSKGSGEKEGVSDINGREESGKRKRMKDKEKVTGCSELECASDQAASKGKDPIDVCSEENVEHMKKGKGKKNKRKNENGGESGEICTEKSGGEAQSGSGSSRKRDREEEVLDVTVEGNNNKKKKKMKKTNSEANVENKEASIGDVEMQNNLESTDESLRNSDSKKSSKRVKFSSQVEVFAAPDDKDDQEESQEKKLIQGKRFTKQEDQIVKDAVYSYIEAHQLGEEGLDMILHCQKHKSVRGCWKEIGKALPYRPSNAVSHRAHILLERAETHEWTEDEKAFVLEFVEKHGKDWVSLGQVLGKSRKHAKDLYRRIKHEDLRMGKWSQEEYQSLFHLVNKDLRMRVFEEKKSKHGMIRDNIGWTAITDRFTRTHDSCCRKWYEQLTSSLVKEEKWSDIDDYRLLNELYKLDACCVEDVDWDNLLEHRPGDVTLKRWRQMVHHIGEHGLQSFSEQVEALSKRYCPELLEVREALDSRPLVD